MKIQQLYFLSTLFLISACSSGTSALIVEPTVAATLVEPAVVKTGEPIIENEIVLLDLAPSPDGKTLAVYLNTGVYLYDIETSTRTVFYEFESDEYYPELNSGWTIYPPFDAPGALAFSPDGSEIAISGKFQDEYISVWDLKDHAIVDYITNYPNGNVVRELEYGPKGETLLIRSTYPTSTLQCPEQGAPPEDTLLLISLDSKNNLFEKKGCNRNSVVDFHFSESKTMYFLHFGESSLFSMDEVNIQTGDIVMSEEIDIRSNGRIYDISPNGRAFAAIHPSNSADGVLHTILIDTVTRKELFSLNGMIHFLGNEDRFLVSASMIPSQDKLKLQENGRTVCAFEELEYFRPYTRISRDHSTMASLTFDHRIFENSIQIWDISDCTLIRKIPLT